MYNITLNDLHNNVDTSSQVVEQFIMGIPEEKLDQMYETCEGVSVEISNAPNEPYLRVGLRDDGIDLVSVDKRMYSLLEPWIRETTQEEFSHVCEKIREHVEETIDLTGWDYPVDPEIVLTSQYDNWKDGETIFLLTVEDLELDWRERTFPNTRENIKNLLRKLITIENAVSDYLVYYFNQKIKSQ